MIVKKGDQEKVPYRKIELSNKRFDFHLEPAEESTDRQEPVWMYPEE